MDILYKFFRKCQLLKFILLTKCTVSLLYRNLSVCSTNGPGKMSSSSLLHYVYDRVSNLKYESVCIDFKTVVFIRANPGKKETTDGSGSYVIFIQKQCTFPEVVSPKKWYVTNIKPWA